MSDWRALADEAAAWAAEGRAATLWWRDDDATARGPQLDRLAALAARHNVDATLAVIPDRIADGFPAFVADHPRLTPIQHGFRHINHAVEGERASEFPESRPQAARRADLRAGAEAFRAAFGAEPGAFTPPWNRMGADLDGVLAEEGYFLCSAFGPADFSLRPLRQNCHLDVVRWREGKRFIGADEALRRLIGGLRERRMATDMNQGREPFGVLTHHIVHRPETWSFLDRLFGETVDRPGLSWRHWRTAVGRPA